MDEQKLSIGFYLKKADNLLTVGINEIRAEFGLTRTDRQILSTIKARNILGRQAMSKILSEFTNGKAINNIISGLIKNGLLQEDNSLALTDNLLQEDNSLALTDKGRDIYQACLQKRILFGQKSM